MDDFAELNSGDNIHIKLHTIPQMSPRQRSGKYEDFECYISFGYYNRLKRIQMDGLSPLKCNDIHITFIMYVS